MAGEQNRPAVDTGPIDVGIGDVVEFADDGGVLGKVTAIVGPGRVTVEFPNGVVDVPVADLVYGEDKP